MGIPRCAPLLFLSQMQPLTLGCIWVPWGYTPTPLGGPVHKAHRFPRRGGPMWPPAKLSTHRGEGGPQGRMRGRYCNDEARRVVAPYERGLSVR